MQYIDRLENPTDDTMREGQHKKRTMTSPTSNDYNLTEENYHGDITKEQPVLISAISDYKMCLEEKIHDLHYFRQWAVPSLADFEIQIGGLKEKLKKFHAEDRGIQTRAAVTDVLVNEACSPISPATDRYQRRSEQKRHQEEAQISSFVNALRQSKRTNTTDDDITPAKEIHKTTEVDVPVRKASTKKRCVYVFGPPRGCPCTIPCDQNNFNLSYD